MERPPPIDWPAPDAFPALASGDVHVWCGWLDDPAASGPEACASLSGEETARAAAFHFEAGRRRYTAAHAMKRGVLARYLGIAPGRLAFAAGTSGKPVLVGGAPHFNLSHSGPLALFAVARDQPLGVDLEQRWELPELALLEERMFTSAALRRQQRLAPGPRLRGFYRRWTQIEAIGKCRGTGLVLAPDAVGTEHLVPADPAPGFTGCLACSRPPARLTLLQWAFSHGTKPAPKVFTYQPPAFPIDNPSRAPLSSS